MNNMRSLKVNNLEIERLEKEIKKESNTKNNTNSLHVLHDLA